MCRTSGTTGIRNNDSTIPCVLLERRESFFHMHMTALSFILNLIAFITISLSEIYDQYFRIQKFPIV